jgi:lipopolysaccharide exporter
MADEFDGLALRTRVVRSAGWVLAGRAAVQGLLVVKLVIMARLLSPEDFGLFGFALLTLGALNTFTQTGFSSALIQRKDNAERYLDTAWTVHVLRALVVGGAMIGTAPLVARFFGEDQIVPLLRVLSGSVVLNGLVNIGVIYFPKQLDFRRQFILDLARGGTSFVVGVALAFALRSVWALIYAHVAAAGVRCIASYAMHGYRPRPSLDRAQAAELFRFGRWVLGSSVVAFLTMQGDDVFLGKLLGATALGAYQIAYQLSHTPATEIALLCGTVMMPTYARVQHQPARLRAAFLEVFELVASAALPLAAFTLFAAHELVVGLLGTRWAAAVVPVQVLAVSALLHVLTATGSPAFIGTGRPHVHFWMNLARLCVMVPTIYPLTKAFGVAGTALSVALGMAAAVPLWARIVPTLHVRWRAVLRASEPGLGLGLLAALGVGLGRFLPAANVQVRLVVELAAGGSFFGLASWAMARRYGRGPYVQARKMLADLRGSRPSA